MPRVVLHTLVYPVIHIGKHPASLTVNSLLIKNKVFFIKKHLKEKVLIFTKEN